MLISVKNLTMKFKKLLSREQQVVLDDISFDVAPGDCLGILGESGSGKSTLGRIITGLLKPTSGEYHFEDFQPYQNRSTREALSSKLSIVFQDYTTSVNPRFTIQEILKESLVLYAKRNHTKVDFKQETELLLDLVGLDASFATRFPHQLSGGQLQRVCIARALAVKPQLILFDEAISSLDAHTQVQIMELLKQLQTQLSLTYLFITHDLTSVTFLCNKVLFLYKGKITEFMEVKDLAKTKDPYAQKLLHSIISL